MSLLKAWVFLLCLVAGISMCVCNAQAVEWLDAETIARQVENQDRLLSEARMQYDAQDHAPLSEPVQYRVLWLGYRNVVFRDLDFQMTKFDEQYLRAVARNFEGTVERIADGNVDITVDLFFIDEPRELTLNEDESWTYLDQTTVQGDIDRYRSNNDYDAVLTTIQEEGDENKFRNADKPDYGVHEAILGLCTAGCTDDIGYSTFMLGTPLDDTYPLRDPAIPSLYATAVAVHEWMHQLEDIAQVLDIEYPYTHAYEGGSEYPGYQRYVADQNNYDYFEFYELVLSGRLPWTGQGSVRLVGMYPKMWPLVKRGALTAHEYTIQNADGLYLSGRVGNRSVTLSNDPCLWQLNIAGNGCIRFQPEEDIDLRIDLENDWDEEGTLVKLQYDTGYIEAQSWWLTTNEDGSVCIRTPHESARAITVTGVGSMATIHHTGTSPSRSQRWFIMLVE